MARRLHLKKLSILSLFESNAITLEVHHPITPFRGKPSSQSLLTKKRTPSNHVLEIMLRTVIGVRNTKRSDIKILCNHGRPRLSHGKLGCQNNSTLS
jgi:hypothetical protein